VFEARSEIGGCAGTVDALGARVNVCNCDHTLVRATPIAEELELARHGLRYLDVDPTQLSLPWWGEPGWLQWRDVATTVELLHAHYADETDGYRRYLRRAGPAVDLLLELALAPPTPARLARRLLERRGRGARTLFDWSRRSCLSVLRSFFAADALIAPAAVTGPGVWGVSPAAQGTGLGALGYAIRHRVGVGRPAGGSGAFPAAVARALEAAGGRVRTGSPVRAVSLERDRAMGVLLECGEEVPARSVVIACDPRRAPLRWRGEAPPQLARWAARAASRGAGDGYQSKLDALVDAPPSYTGLDDVAVRPTAVVSPRPRALVEADAAMRAGQIVRRPPFLVNVPTAVDASMLAGTRHVFSLEPLYTPYRFDWRGAATEPERWLREYAALVQPGFARAVRTWRVVAPPDWEREFGLPRGAAQTFAASPVAAALGRDGELTRYETPLTGLFLTGQATFPGAGVWGASGRNAARVILERGGVRLSRTGAA
jgi:phytoene dehydrogenase-like protein